jgi:hypothetical protein
MSRFVRRSLFVAVVALVAVPFAAIGSSAQEVDDLVIRVGKQVVGTGAPSVVTLDCVGNPDDSVAQAETVLNFDAQGNPTGDVEGWDIEDGMWVVSGDTDGGGHCSFTETTTGGASSTSWTCDYEADVISIPKADQIEQAGCEAIAGVGVGPVEVEYPGADEVFSQESTVVFTNTFTAAPVDPPAPAAGIVARPAFTG